MNLVKYLGITTHQIAALLPVTERTIQRYTPNQHFNSVVSEHILQIAEVAAKGAEVFDSKEQFRLWLSLPNKALGNKTPLSLMNTKRGSDMVMDILVRIEHGVYS
jgi:putative toxin-antitoxin system antitoxin component (TIGR02293 family)